LASDYFYHLQESEYVKSKKSTSRAEIKKNLPTVSIPTYISSTFLPKNGQTAQIISTRRKRLLLYHKTQTNSAVSEALQGGLRGRLYQRIIFYLSVFLQIDPSFFL